jgi:hypothetical protein
MKPITSKVKKSCSPLKQTKTVSGYAKDEQGNLLKAEGSATPGAPGKGGTPNVDKLKAQGIKSKSLEGYGLRNPAARAAANKALADAKAKDLEISGGSEPSITAKYEPVLTEEKKGTASDVFKTWDQRKYGAGGRIEKIQQRQERKAGRQEERRLNRAARKGVIDKNSQEYKDQLMAAKKKRYGQGTVAQEIRKQMEDPSQALIHREQITQKKTPRLSTYTRNFEVPTKFEAGGQNVKADESTKTKPQFEEDLRSSMTGGSGSVVIKKSAAQMKSSALKMTTSASPFKMKGYGKKGC